MKVLIASTIVPFGRGGGMQIADWLEASLARAGHEVEVFRIPFHSYYPVMPDQMLALRLFDVSRVADRLVAIRTPSYLLRHSSKVVWFIHHHRGAYDLWGTKYQDLPNTAEGERYREMIMHADNVALGEARKLFTNSRVAAQRLQDFNGLEASVLYPPLFEPERFRCEEYGDAVVYISRIVPHKRQLLAAEALLHTSTDVKLIIAGPPDDPGYVGQIEKFAVAHGLRDRLMLKAEWISEEQKATLLAKSLAAVYVPYDEDSYGYVGLEAQHSRKAVVTTTDAGGPLELINHEVNGLITAPEPAALAAALDRLWRERDLARTLGEAGRARIRELGVNWGTVARELLG